jgi:hypothetical protein
LLAQIQAVTGAPGTVFEARRPADTGSWGMALAYGGTGAPGAGGWGNLDLPFQCLVIAHRPHLSGAAATAGYCIGPGGYGEGAIEYANSTQVTGAAIDTAVLAAIAEVMPACGIAWTQIIP